MRDLTQIRADLAIAADACGAVVACDDHGIGVRQRREAKDRLAADVPDLLAALSADSSPKGS